MTALALFLAFYPPFASFQFAVNFIASELCDLQLDKREPGVAISSSLFGNSFRYNRYAPQGQHSHIFPYRTPVSPWEQWLASSPQKLEANETWMSQVRPLDAAVSAHEDNGELHTNKGTHSDGDPARALSLSSSVLIYFT